MRRLILSLLFGSLPVLAAAAAPGDTQLQDALHQSRTATPEVAFAKFQKLQAAFPGLPGRAVTALKQRVKQAPTDGNAWFDLGILEIVSSEPHAALAAFAKAEQYRPQDPYPFAYHGFALVEAGSPQSAMVPLQTALKLDPHNHFANWVLAQAYFRQGNQHLAAKLMNPPSKAIRTASP